MNEYSEIKWRLKQRHLDRLDKVRFLEERLHEKEQEIRRLKLQIKKRTPQVIVTSDNDELKSKAEDAKRLIKQGQHGAADKLMRKINIEIALREARKLVERDPIKARQQLVKVQQLMSQGRIEANDLRKYYFEIKEIKTDIELQKI